MPNARRYRIEAVDADNNMFFHATETNLPPLPVEKMIVACGLMKQIAALYGVEIISYVKVEENTVEIDAMHQAPEPAAKSVVEDTTEDVTGELEGFGAGYTAGKLVGEIQGYATMTIRMSETDQDIDFILMKERRMNRDRRSQGQGASAGSR